MDYVKTMQDGKNVLIESEAAASEREDRRVERLMSLMETLNESEEVHNG